METFVMCDYDNNNVWNSDCKDFMTIQLITEEFDQQYYFEGFDNTKEENNSEQIIESNTIEVDYGISPHCFLDPQETMLDKTLVKNVPNILKKNSKLSRTIFSELNEMDINSITEITEKPLHENESSKNQIEIKQRSKRKQGLDITDKCCKVSNLNNCSFVDNQNSKIRKKDNLKSCPKQTTPKNLTKKQDRKKVSVFRTERKEVKVPEFASAALTSHSNNLSNLKNVQSNDLEDLIDFSSNEIFSKYNYESFDDSYLYNFADVYSNETQKSLSINNDNDINKEYDLNSNKVDPFNIDSLLPMPSEYSNKDASLSEDKEWNLLSESNCNRCFGNCGINWLTTCQIKEEMPRKDKTASATQLNESTTNLNNAIDLNHSNLDNVFPLNDAPTEIVSHDFDIVEQLYRECIMSDQRSHCNVFTDVSSLSDFDLLQFDLDKLLSTIEEQIPDEYTTTTMETLKIEEIQGSDSTKDALRCMTCFLTFSHRRTLALHKSEAHGGPYIAHCGHCGRFFNRKYNFNRHFVYCCRMKGPFKCTMCKKIYRHKSSLVNHLKVVHNSDYVRNHLTTFVCEICKKVYNRFGALTNHMKKHQDASGNLLNYPAL